MNLFRNMILSTAMTAVITAGSLGGTAVAGDAGSAFVGGLLGGAAGSAATNIYFENKREKERAAAAASQPTSTYYGAPAAS